jgi:hypothetical protein
LQAIEWSVSVVERGAIRGCEYTTDCLAVTETSAHPKYKEPEIEAGTLHLIAWRLHG